MLTYNKDTSALELYDGAAFGPVGSDAGLIHINTTSFSAVASQSFNNVFSSTYDYYRVIATGSTSGDFNLHLRFRFSGVDNTTASSYRAQRIKGSGASVTASLATENYMFVGSWRLNGFNSNVFDILNPFLSEETVLHYSNNRDNNPTEVSVFTGIHEQSVSYDGFTLLPSSGTLTGKLSVFGYAKV
jgi:hypothetical protein